VTPTLRWTLGGAVLTWATLLAPPLVLLAWLGGVPAWPWPILAVPLAPVGFGLMVRALRGDSALLRRWWMQAFGLGALLAPIVLVAVPLRAFVGPTALGALALACWLALAVFAHRAARRVHERVLRVDMPGLGRTLRLVQLSDVHIGSRAPDSLERLVERVQRIDPDLVVITGDLVDASDIAEDALASLSRLSMPCLMCLGNHERYTRLPATLARIERAGVTVLRDEATRVHGLTVIGLDDRDRPDELSALLGGLLPSLPDGPPDRMPDASAPPDAACTLLLYHRPDGWRAARASGIRLMLAGHTHAGQIWPFALLVRRVYPELVGRFDADGSTLYVSPGAGTWGPLFRLGTRSEMTLVELHDTSA